MKNTIHAILVILFSLLSGVLQGADTPTDSIPEWVKDAKLGIFIHWGIYSVKPTGESWPMRNGEISVKDYMAQLEGFTAAKYDPDAWARLFKEAGADYAVLTTKHHDGVALWDTQANDLSVVKKSPAGRDLVGPFVKALRKQNLKVGLYYSHLDWSHPDYNSVQKPGRKATNPFEYRGHDDPEAWERFLRFHRKQMKELCVNYSPDYLWFDGNWERSEEQWRIDELCDQLEQWRPGVIYNKRIGADRGIIGSAEQSLPIFPPDDEEWEFCMTSNDHWSYMPGDDNWKTPAQIVRIFVETVSMDGKLLLNIAPDAQGVFEDKSKALLRELGQWNARHREAIWNTRKGISRYHCNLPTTVSTDNKTLYVFLFDQPRSELLIKGLLSKVETVTILGEERKVPFLRRCGAGWAQAPYMLWIDLPHNLEMGYGRVVKVHLSEPIRTFGGEVGQITQN
jgi:alpha-L-fucosidase